MLNPELFVSCIWLSSILFFLFWAQIWYHSCRCLDSCHCQAIDQQPWMVLMMWSGHVLVFLENKFEQPVGIQCWGMIQKCKHIQSSAVITRLQFIAIFTKGLSTLNVSLVHPALHWQQQNINQNWKSQQTSHSLPLLRASYGVVCCDEIRENWTHYNSTALHLFPQQEFNTMSQLIVPWGIWLQSQITKFQTHFNDEYLKYFLWNCYQVNATTPHRSLINIGSSNGLVPSGNKPLLEPMLT